MTQRADYSSQGRGTARITTVLALSYPLIAHAAVLSANPKMIAASAAMLAVIILLPGLRAGRPVAWVLLVGAGLGLYAVAGRGQVLLLLFLPPILINGFMAWVFGHTLQRGHMPLIERIVRVLHGNPSSLDVEIVAYARHLTWTWACLFVAMAAVNLALAAVARPGGLLLAVGLDPPVTVPLSTWSLFANVLNYVVVGALFVVEYWMRQRRFPQQGYRGFFDFMRRLAGVSAIFRPASAGTQRRSDHGSGKP